jgi:DNA invertase Pin-like site-specific DNA recombinase
VTSTSDEFAAVRDLPLREDRIRAANAYIERVETDAREHAAEVRKFRDDEVRALIQQFGPSEAARRSGLSLSTVKRMKGRP